MALVNCKECNKEVSEWAESCMSCGVAIELNPADASIKTTKKTSKKLKLYTLSSIFLIIVGVALLITTFDQGKAITFPIILIGLGIIFNLVTRVRIWWHRK